MPSAQTARDSAENRESSRENQAVKATLRMRLWAYGSESKLTDLVLSNDKPVAELIDSVVRDSQGTVIDQQHAMVVAHFTDALHALTVAKSLQVKLLTLYREAPAGQVVAAIMVESEGQASAQSSSGTDSTTRVISSSQILAEANSAQILVSQEIYELAKNVPGFEFNTKPAREASETGTSEAVYELRWTDESTYGHLRKTSHTPAPEVPRERRYKIESELGRGCMGVVYKAYDQVIGRPVALKTIAVSRNFPNREVLIERLKQEAKTAGSLDHPNIITIYDVGQEDDLLYLSMQLIEGKTLSAIMSDGSLPPLPTLLAYADQICSAVGYAHQKGVIHRDLKPANFMLTSHGTIKVLDFGIAKIEDATLTQAGMIVGTPTYMAPEQARGKEVDQRSDIFSLGSVFYELFSREKPFKGDITTILYKLIHEDPVPPVVINPALPSGIDVIIRKALAKNPKDRFQSCEEMREAFEEQAASLKSSSRAQAGVPKTTPAAHAQQKPVTVEDLLAEVRPRRSYRAAWIALTVCLLAAAGGAATWAFRVKARTGSFPPVIEKVLATFHRAKADGSNAGQQSALQPSTNGQDSQQHATTGSTGNAPGTGDQQSTGSNSGNQPAPIVPEAAQPSSTTASDTKTEPAADSPSDSTSASSENAREPQPTEPSPFEPRKKNPKPAASTAQNTLIKVEGFTRRDVPLLLSKADAATGRGDYALARYEYEIILKLDRRNATAHAGLRRVIAAQQEQKSSR